MPPPLAAPNPADTIVAPASGHARSTRAIIRLSGPGLPSLLDTVLEAPPRTRGIWRAKFRLGESRVLPVLVLNFPAPDSYTGEHAAELLIPGNPNLVARVIAAITAHPSVREATPGEFSARAFLNGKLTVEQAEGVAATIAAATDDQLAAARLLLAGETGRRYQQWADEVATLLALVEAGIDFTDQEDVIPIAPGDLVQRLTCVLEQIESACGSLAGAEQGESRPTVVLSGRPNAGKSTLFNALLGRTRAVVSPLAGTTRDVLAEPLDLSADVPGGPVVTLIDLAGLDEAAPSGATADANAQLAAREALAAADVVIHCDPTGRFADPISSPPNRATIRIRTMGDLPVSSGSAVSDALAVCALDGWNLAPLRRAIADAAWSAAAGGGVSRNADTLLPRHRRVLTAAAGSISAALETVRPDAPRAGGGRLAAPELVAGSLREALDTLGELTGRISPDDIVGRIFATFCVGK